MYETPKPIRTHMDVSENSGTPKTSILIGFSIINHPFWGTVPLFLETPISSLVPKGTGKGQTVTYQELHSLHQKSYTQQQITRNQLGNVQNP